MQQYLNRLVPAGRWPAELAVWHLRLPQTADEADWTCLDLAERQRASRYRRPEDRLRFALTRACLRHLLGQQLGRHPASLHFLNNPWGRPALAGGELSFNVSHSHEHALIAISAGHRPGVDIEWIDPELDWHALLDTVCTPREQQALEAAPAEQRRQRFFACWTAKEAVLKAWGRGIGGGLTQIDCSAAQPAAGGHGLTFEGQSWQLCRLEDIRGYSACLAYQAGTAPA